MIYKKGRYYMEKFMWEGKLVRKSTRATDRKTARAVEGKIRAELARGNWGILEATPAPTLADFLKRDFLPYSESKFKDKRETLRYYRDGVKRLLASEIATLRLSEITDQHARQYEGRWSLVASLALYDELWSAHPPPCAITGSGMGHHRPDAEDCTGEG